MPQDQDRDPAHENYPQDSHQLRIYDTSDGLTKDELTELKKLASMSRTTRAIFAVGMGLAGLVWLPDLVTWLGKHLAGMVGTAGGG